MSEAITGQIADYLAQSRDIVAAAIADPSFAATVVGIVDRVGAALSAGNKILLAGNGGSAADAQHLAGEIVGRFYYDRAPAAAIPLGADIATMTAIANDYGYERVFERQVRGLGRPGDVLIGLSTSGRSPNILYALSAARDIGLVTVGFTGRNGGDMPPLCDLCLRVPADTTPLIQQLHMIAGHLVCALVEERLFPRTDSPPLAAG